MSIVENSRSVLVTGATGLIGRHFIKRFPEYRYTALTRKPDLAKKVLPTDTHIIKSLHHLKDLDDFDAVINLAGEPIIDSRWTEKQKKKISQSRWDTTYNIVDLIAQGSNPPKTFISGSAIGYYGEAGNSELSEKDSPSNHDFAHNLCREWESIAQKASTNSRVCLIRTGIVLSRDGGALKKMWFPFKIGLGGPIGDGNQFMSWIHIDDQVNAIQFLLESHSLSGPFNLTAPIPVTNQKFSNVLAKKFNKGAHFRVPEFVLKMMLGERSSLLLDSQKIIPRALLASGFKFRFSTIEEAIENL